MADIVQQLRKPPFGTESSERNLMERAAHEIEQLRGVAAMLGHVIVAAGGEVTIPSKNIQQCQFPMMAREDDLEGNIKLSAKLA